MRFFCKIVLIGLCTLGLQACGYIDDYILGKDNTLRPNPLPVIHAKVSLHQLWSAKIGQSHQTPTYYKLKTATVAQKIYTADTRGKVTA